MPSQAEVDGAPSGPTASDAPPSTTVRGCVWAGLNIGLIGATVLGIVESVLATWTVVRHTGEPDVPFDLVLAGFGKSTATQALLWCPLLALGGLGYWITRRRGAADAFLVSTFVVLAGALVLPADLRLAGRFNLLTVTALGLATVAAAVIAFRIVGSATRGPGAARVARIRNGTTVVCAMVTTVLAAFFARSPLAAEDSYRVPSAKVGHAGGGRRNVLWIVLDTARADRMSCHGYAQPTTPFLDEWAEGSIVFDRAVANGIWTVPSHASMFTGKSVRAHGLDHRRQDFDEATTTVAARLRGTGYATASFSNNPWIAPECDLSRGFETCSVVFSLRGLSRFSLEYLWENRGWTPVLPWFDRDYGAATTNHLIAGWLDERAEEEVPFLLFVNYMEAHLPYRVPRKYRRMFMTEDQVARSYRLRWREYGNIVDALGWRFNNVDSEFLAAADREVLRRQYDAAIRYLDDRVRELIEMFDRRGLLADTLVIVCSDHGEYLDDHGMWEHRYFAYNDVARVSLIIREPGRTTGRRVLAPVELADLYPTIMRFALGEPGADGPYASRDLLELVDKQPQWRPVITEYTGPTPRSFGHKSAPVGGRRDHPQLAAQDQRYKYMISGDGYAELYDLATDTGELHNLIESDPANAERFAHHLEAWLAAVPKRETPDEDEMPQLDAERIRQLQSLGYLGDQDSKTPTSVPADENHRE